MNQIPSFKFELELGKGKIVAGVDEVGRGALAGPIVAAAVVFSNYENIILSLDGVVDSKKLTPSQREKFSELIKSKASSFSIGEVSAEEIDKIGIGAANIVAFKRALDGLPRCDLALIDGRKFHGFEYDFLCLEKGESKSISIAAASIIAKVYRDRLMCDFDTLYPEYDFAKNKGYGEKKHYLTLNKLGPSKCHRQSFLSKFQFDQSRLF